MGLAKNLMLAEQYGFELAMSCFEPQEDESDERITDDEADYE